MDGAQVVSLLIALGAGGILLELVKRIADSFSGRGKKRRDEVDRAWGARDEEARKRRISEEHASHVRRLLIEAPCVDNSAVPPYPNYKE